MTTVRDRPQHKHYAETGELPEPAARINPNAMFKKGGRVGKLPSGAAEDESTGHAQFQDKSYAKGGLASKGFKKAHPKGARY